MALARRVLLALLAALVVAAVVPVNPDAPVSGDETVYVTRTGAKYHRETCSSLRYSKRAIRLKDAGGYGPCSRCSPPVLSSSKTAASGAAGEIAMGRCQATTRKGTQCSRRARAGGFCWQHGG